MNINKDDLSKLSKLYNKAVKDKKATFIYKEEVILTNYAKYLIKYLKINYL